MRTGAKPSHTVELKLLALLIALTTAITSCSDGGGVALSGYERSPTPYVGDIALPSVEPDGTETDFAFSADEEDLLLVYFGYTSCPDVCPTTLADIRVALEDLGQDSDRISLAMVTIDVGVDTPEVLANYVRSFIPSATAIRSLDDDALQSAAEMFGASYGTTVVDGNEEVFHTGSVYVVDSSGNLVLTWPFGTTPLSVSADLGILLKRVDAA